MKKRFLCAFAVVMLFATSCGKAETTDGDFLTPPPVLTGTATPTPKFSFQPSELKTFTYYTISDSMMKEEATAVLASETILTPEYLVEYVADSMSDSLIMIKIDSVTEDGKRVIVSFQEDSMPVCDTREQLEGEILDAIAQSILENLEEYSGVIFRVMGEGYASENRSYDRDYVYLSH